MALTTRLTARVETTYTGSLDLATPTTALDYLKRLDWTSGTGSDQADLMWSDQRTLAGSTAEDLDLAGSLTDEFGNTLTFSLVKGIVIYSAAANGDILKVGGDANGLVNWVASATDIVQVRPGGLLALFAPDATGYSVTAGTGDVLQVENADASAATYDIVIIGVSA